MEELLREIRKNRNTKYYSLLVKYFDIINDDHDHHVRLSVDEIIKGAGVSRPTFYTYYEGAEEFYVDLMEIMARVWPQYMQKLSKEQDEKDFLKVAFTAKLGVALSNMKKIAGKFPKVLDPWNAYFDKAVLQMGAFYARIKGVSSSEGEKISRMVLNELILHDDVYYQDFNAYRALMLEQKTHTFA